MSDEQQQNKVPIKALVLGILAATAFVFAFWQAPWWFDSLHIRKTNLEPADGVIITGVRTGLVAFAAGIIAGIGLYYTHNKHDLEQRQFEHARQQFQESQKQFETTLRETQKRDQEQAELTREGQVTGRYVEAIKLLASKGTHERLGGIYSLERILKDSEKDRTTIVEVLAAYARTRLDGTAPESTPPSAENPGQVSAAAPNRIPLPEDIRAALSVLGRNWRIHKDRQADLRSLNLKGWDASETDLTGAEMSEANLEYAYLRNATLKSTRLLDANLSEANLSGAQLARALLIRAYLHGANLQQASLYEANLEDAFLDTAHMGSATLSHSQLDGARIRRANLTHADLTGATLHDARLTHTDLTMANLNGTNLTGTHGLTVDQLCRAIIVSSTKLPANLAAHPQVQARIDECDAARAASKRIPMWTSPSTARDKD